MQGPAVDPVGKLHLADAFVLAHEAGDRGVVQDQSAARCGGAGERERQAGVVELPVRIRHAAAQPLASQPRHGLQGLFARQAARLRPAVPARQPVVKREPEAVEGPFAKPAGRQYQPKRVDQVRGHASQGGALLQCLAHQLELTTPQVAYAAVHHLGTA